MGIAFNSGARRDGVSRGEKKILLIVVFLAALALLATLPYLVRGELRTFIHLDDDFYVFDNPNVLRGVTGSGLRWAFSTFHAGNWHPLTWLSHQLDASLFGTAAWGHHLTSVVLHALNTVLLFVVLSRLTGALWASGFAAALFGAHPLRVESVAWVAERKDVLSALFFLLVLLAYERYARRGGAQRYLSVAGLLALGLLAKPMLVTVPFVLLLLDAWPLGRTRTRTPAGGVAGAWRRLLLEKIPLLALCVASSVITYLAQRQGDAVRDLTRFTPVVRLSNTLVSYATYLGKSVWPARLAIYYPHPLAVPPWWELAGVVLLLGLVTLAAVRWSWSRPYFAVGWLWYLGMLLPVIGLVQVGDQALADRYTYLPGVGLVIIIAWVAPEAFRAMRLRAVATAAVAMAVLGALTTLTIVQVGRWRDSETLFRHTLAVSSGNWLIQNNLGNVLDSSNRPEEAIEHFREALRLRPGYADAHLNLGIALDRLGRSGEAMEHFREAIRLRPDIPEPYSTLAGLFSGMGRSEEAIALCQAALNLKPDYPDAHNNLGIALARAGRFEEGISHLQEALRLRPGNRDYQMNLALARSLASRRSGQGAAAGVTGGDGRVAR